MGTVPKECKLQHSLGIMTEIFTDKKRAQEICPGVAVDDAVGFLPQQRRTRRPFLTTFAFRRRLKKTGVLSANLLKLLG